ncbi:MAG: metallophosphoesterase [Spirochaetales bacterium]
MIYYIADTHFGHKNIIRMCNRPFASIDEMNETLINNWNKKVKPTDTVYIIGDMFHHLNRDPSEILERLNGEKHLILGNHDPKWLRNYPQTAKYFKTISRMELINVTAGTATLCHYPMFSFEGKYLIYGHIHEKRQEPLWSYTKDNEFMLNAGVDVNNFEPVNFYELQKNNAIYKAKNYDKPTEWKNERGEAKETEGENNKTQ